MKAPSEKHLEDWLFEDANRLPNAACCFGRNDFNVYRQLQLSSGILDLLYIEDDSMTVVELKKGEIDAYALTQILRYIGDLKIVWEECVGEISCSPEYLASNPPRYHGGLKVSGILIGYKCSNQVMVAAEAANVGVMKYEYDGTNYEIDWDYHDYRWNQANPLIYSDIGDAMVRMARNFMKKIRYNGA